MKYLFNNARNCLRIFLRTTKVDELWMPYELCSIIFRAVKTENVRLNFYHIDKNFAPAQDFPQNAYILYPNYFGICDEIALNLAEKYPNFIYDATQSFFSNPLGIATIYSARKFFQVADGGILITEMKIPTNFPQEEDIPQFSTNPLNFDYENFLKNELKFNRDKNIKIISNKSHQFLAKLNLKEEIHLRRENFKRFHKQFGAINELTIPKNIIAPMVYPIKSKNNEEIAEKLLKQGVFLLQYNYLKNIIPIPTSLCSSIKL